MPLQIGDRRVTFRFVVDWREYQECVADLLRLPSSWGSSRADLPSVVSVLSVIDDAEGTEGR
jgi:hypothetical protein